MRSLRFVRSEAGAAAVEFALVAPLFMLLVFGIIEYSRVFYTKNYISTGVREGARLASIRPDPCGTDIDLVKDAVMNYSRPFGAAIRRGDIGVACDQFQVTVSVTRVPYSAVTPLGGMGVLGFAGATFTDTAVFRRESAPP